MLTVDVLPPPSETGPGPETERPDRDPVPLFTSAPSSTGPEAPRDDAASGRIEVEGLNAYYGVFRAIRDVTLALEPQAVTAIIGPSGCGKSTFLRSLNRMHELAPGASSCIRFSERR
ncbi:MAG TPA: ATP-binding cassette domain-containing protein, partial [Candidatus Limnocylindrales bacterium]|nr:ATP-binding cassette domain-containing protein [Candidatus Limnocylindrales bacterium]